MECGRAAFTFTLLAPAPSWRPALEAFLDGLFAPSLGPAAIEAARADLHAELALDRANPSWQAHLSGWQSLYGDVAGGGAWARPACGVPETLELFQADAVRAAAEGLVRPYRSTAAVVGPVDPETAEALLDERIAGDGFRGLLPAPPPARRGRRYVERNTVTAWLTIGYRFGATTDPVAVRLLGAILENAVSPSVARPDVYLAEHDVVLDGAGGTLFIRVIAAPGAVATYARTIESLVEAIARSGPTPAVHERVGRRQLGVSLRRLSTPEARAAARAFELARGRAPVGFAEPGTAIAAVGADAVRDAAAALGPAARAVVGPRAARSAIVP